MKLEQATIYLPYNITAIHNEDIKGVEYKAINLTDRFYSMPTAVLTNYKLILKPLSDLTKEDLIEDLGTQTSHLDWTTVEREHWIRFYNREHWVNNLPHLIYNYLVKNLYDINGLIEKGLAIDVNDL